MMTPTEARAAWVQALRSGEYEQDRGALVQNDDGVDKYCCLGVACELAIADGVAIERQGNIYWDSNTGAMEGGLLLEPVRQWLGLTSREGAYGPAGYETDLTADNDGGESFDQIADKIEQPVPGLIAND